MSRLLERIENKTAELVVVGIGYAGLPLATAFASAGFRVTGLDRDAERVRLLNAGESYIPDVSAREIAPEVSAQRLRATTNVGVLAEADAVVVCVPTPLNKTKEPDLSFIVDAMDEIARYQHPDMLIVLESTSYPGTTTELVVPRLTDRGLQLGQDVFVAFSPERVDPGNREFRTRNTPKVIGGATPACLAMATALYRNIIDTLVPVSTTECAEMVKLLENTFRAVNIGLVNEMAIMSRRLGLDPFEVMRAAATKPFGFMPFWPGPGLGGHCIPVDSLFLSWKLRSMRYSARFIELADAINSSMPGYVVERVAEALNDHGKPVRGSRILVYGVAYKANVSDVREGPAITILKELETRGAQIAYMDPHVPELSLGDSRLRAVHSGFDEYDAVVIVTDHAQLDRERLLAEARLVIDTRDALRGTSDARVYRL